MRLRDFFSTQHPKKRLKTMKTIPFTATATALAAVLLLNTPCSQAQDATPAPIAAPAAETPAAPPAPGNGGDRMEQFRQKMNEFLKTALKASDEEWSIIQPLLEKVQTNQRETMMGRFNLPGGRRGGGDRAGRPERPASPEVDALKAALEAEGASPADIKTRLEAVRAARKKALAELDQAREDLRKVLTQRQEATLVMVGILE